MLIDNNDSSTTYRPVAIMLESQKLMHLDHLGSVELKKELVWVEV